MSMVLAPQLIGPRGTAPVAITYVATAAANDGGTLAGSPHTFTAVGTGTADTKRKVIVAVNGQMSGTADAVTDVTVGGIVATKLGSTATSNTTNEIICEFWGADVPTGTSDDIVVTYSGTWYRLAVSTFDTRYSAVYAEDLSGSTETANDAVGSIDIVKDGGVIALVANNGASAYAWTGLTERVDTQVDYNGETYTAASDIFAAAETARAITAAQDINNSPQSMNILSLK